jgi:hypothetical protein
MSSECGNEGRPWIPLFAVSFGGDPGDGEVGVVEFPDIIRNPPVG